MSKLRLIWHPDAWDDYVDWQSRDRAMVKRINRLVSDIQRDPEGPGLGKPELLKGPMSGLASRRIDGEHRLVYKVKPGDLEIHSCRGHYE